MKNIAYFLLISLLFACGSADNNSNSNNIAVDAEAFAEKIKYSQGDPFIETIKESEFFKVSGLEDKVIETKDGTIISIPKGAFRDADGNIVEKEVTIEITDINTFEEQFNANINSPAGQNIALNGGAIYINATADGGQLAINSDSPIYIETTQKSNPDLLVFEGIRNDKGEMQWINPKQPKRYLIPVDLEELDFLPENFALTVERNMPFRKHKVATKELIDSLYFSLKNGDKKSCYFLQLTEYDEIYAGHSAANNYSSNYDTLASTEDMVWEEGFPECKAITPASIKVIKGEKFEKSFIATKQFEERMRTIHSTRMQEVLEVYTNNLTQDLAYCDSLAANLLKVGEGNELKFRSYAKENWGNIENLPPSVKKLGAYYSSQLKETEKELKETREAYAKELKKKSDKAKKLQEEYKKLLTKRQNYRIEKHGYTVDKLGWSTVAITLETFEIDIEVKNGEDYDRVLVYTIDPSIKSIFAWQSADKVNFNYAFAEDNLLIYKKNLQAKVIVVAYKGKEPFMDVQDFRVTKKIDIDLKLKPTTQTALNNTLNQFDQGSKDFNKVTVDLEYQAAFYEEKQRLKTLAEERLFVWHLHYFVFHEGWGYPEFAYDSGAKQ